MISKRCTGPCITRCIKLGASRLLLSQPSRQSIAAAIVLHSMIQNAASLHHPSLPVHHACALPRYRYRKFLGLLSAKLCFPCSGDGVGVMTTCTFKRYRMDRWDDRSRVRILQSAHQHSEATCHLPTTSIQLAVSGHVLPFVHAPCLHLVHLSWPIRTSHRATAFVGYAFHRGGRQVRDKVGLH